MVTTQLICTVTAQLISAFVFAIKIVPTIPLLPKSKISSLKQSSAIVQPGFSQTWSETPKTGIENDTDYQHDSCADNPTYRHYRSEDKRPYRHIRDMRCTVMYYGQNCDFFGIYMYYGEESEESGWQGSSWPRILGRSDFSL